MKRCKLLETENCILKSSCNYLRNSAENCAASSVNWARDVKNELFHVGLGEFWIGQQSLNPAQSLHIYEDSIFDIYMKESKVFMENSSECILYRYLAKHNYSKIQSYLTKPIQNNLKTHFFRIRLSSHCLNIETGRYQGKSGQFRLCDICDTRQIEDEFHFFLQCPKFYILRKKIFKRVLLYSPSTFNLL